MSANNKNSNDLPYADKNVGDLETDLDIEGEVPELSAKQKEQFKNRYGKTSVWQKVKDFGSNLIRGKNKIGRYLGLGLSVGETFLPKWIGRIRDMTQSKTQPKNDNNMNWLLNRLTERSTWRGVIVALTSAGILTLGEEMRTAIVGAGVSLFVLIEVFVKEPQSKDAN